MTEDDNENIGKPITIILKNQVGEEVHFKVRDNTPFEKADLIFHNSLINTYFQIFNEYCRKKEYNNIHHLRYYAI